MRTPRKKLVACSALLALLLVPFANCAPGKPMKAEYVEPSIGQKISSILESDHFTVEYYKLGGTGGNVVYTAVFNRRQGVLMVDHSTLSADGAIVTQLCSVTWSGGELSELETSLQNIDLTDEDRPAVLGGEAWLVFVDRKGSSFRVYFEGSANSSRGKTVITGGQFLRDIFARRGTCPT